MRTYFAIILFLAIMSATAAAAFNVTQVFTSPDTGFLISDYSQTPDRVFPGDQVNLKMQFRTSKTSAADVLVTANTPFLGSDAGFSFGSMQAYEIRPLQLSFTVPSTTKPGTYPIYVYAKDAYSPQKEIARIHLVVLEPSLSGVLTAKILSPKLARTGSTSDVVVEIFNTGILPSQDILVRMVANKSEPFTPLESDRVYLRSLDGGTRVPVTFKVGVAADASPGYYPLTVSLQYAVDNVVQPTSEQELGLTVESNALLLVSSETRTDSNGGAALLFTVANVGDTAVRGVYAQVTSPDYRIVGASDKFIGTLNLDDSSSLSVSLVPRPNGQREGLAHLRLTYKDSLNREHVVEKDVEVSGSGGSFTGSGISPGAQGSNQRFIRNRPDGLNFLGLGLLQWTGILVFIIVAAFLVFRWNKRKARK